MAERMVNKDTQLLSEHCVYRLASAETREQRLRDIKKGLPYRDVEYGLNIAIMNASCVS